MQIWAGNDGAGIWYIDEIQARTTYALSPTLTPSPAATPTSIPTPTPSISSAPSPFLDLPWNYEGKGMTFSDAALAINSYFDHEYPLLSSGLILPEPIDVRGTTRTFMGFRRTQAEGYWYSSHDGYDYGWDAHARDGDPVYPAASGSATYIYDYWGGNTIMIDHLNGYQTVYYHLQNEGLITKQPGVKVSVDRNTQIGRVGSTGSHTTGPHIHIGVFQDKNHDGRFDDNVPDGATDPFGWQSKDTDPWESYSFFYNGQQRTGNKSYYLWKNKIDGLSETLSANGGVFSVGHYEVEFPEGTTDQALKLDMQLTPQVNASAALASIGPSIDIVARNLLGDLVTLFTKPLIIVIDFTQADLSRFEPGTISVYSSKDRVTWTKEASIVDYFNKKATAEVSHLTYFALMGELSDLVVPTTEAVLAGIEGQANFFRSDASLELNAVDKDDGLGIEYTLYKIEGEDWTTYGEPLQFTNERQYKIEFYSGDKGGNVEYVKSVEFKVDKSAPVTSASASGTMDENGWNVSDVLISLSAQDAGSGIAKTEYSLDEGATYSGYNDPIDIATEGASQILYRSIDKAGNVEEAKVADLKIDKTAPDTLVYITGLGSENWYRSDVKMAFNAQDVGSGFARTYFSLNDGGYQEYQEPFVISSEGISIIHYYSVDIAGNAEDHKDIEIKVDKTAPEANIEFDASAQDLIISGVDDSGPTTISHLNKTNNSEQITIKDKAGNSLVITDTEREHGPNSVLSLSTLSYNGNNLALDVNKLSIRYQLDKWYWIKTFEQKYEAKGALKILLSYDPQASLTTIAQDKQNAAVGGMKFLQLTTDKGLVEYNVH